MRSLDLLYYRTKIFKSYEFVLFALKFAIKKFQQKLYNRYPKLRNSTVSIRQMKMTNRSEVLRRINKIRYDFGLLYSLATYLVPVVELFRGFVFLYRFFSVKAMGEARLSELERSGRMCCHTPSKVVTRHRPS